MIGVRTGLPGRPFLPAAAEGEAEDIGICSRVSLELIAEGDSEIGGSFCFLLTTVPDDSDDSDDSDDGLLPLSWR